jgi:glycosyltransferase involved in cell wall biosynthesis
MKILTISNYFPNRAGGIEIVAKNLVKNWRDQHTVHWAACETEDWQGRQEDDVSLPACNFTETHLGFPYPIPYPRSIVRIANEVRWCDIVHLHDCLYLSSLIAFLFAKVFSKPLITTQHIGVVPYREKYKVLLQKFAYKILGKMVLRGSDKVIFINEKTRKWFAEIMILRNTLVLQNGVDGRIFFPIKRKTEKYDVRKKMGYSENDFIFLFIGRFTQKKGVDIILEVAKARPIYKWLLIGSSDIPASKQKLKNMNILPYRNQDELREFYIAADLFVLPSQGEGFPLSVQEALTCGLPAAVSEETASSLPDAPLISLNIESIPSVVNTLDGAATRPDILNELSLSSAEYAKRWNWNLISKQYLENFDTVLRKTERRFRM